MILFVLTNLAFLYNVLPGWDCICSNALVLLDFDPPQKGTAKNTEWLNMAKEQPDTMSTARDCQTNML